MRLSERFLLATVVALSVAAAGSASATTLTVGPNSTVTFASISTLGFMGSQVAANGGPHSGLTEATREATFSAMFSSETQVASATQQAVVPTVPHSLTFGGSVSGSLTGEQLGGYSFEAEINQILEFSVSDPGTTVFITYEFDVTETINGSFFDYFAFTNLKLTDAFSSLLLNVPGIAQPPATPGNQSDTNTVTLTLGSAGTYKLIAFARAGFEVPSAGDGDLTASYRATVTVLVPEPGTLALAGLGCGVALLRRRPRRITPVDRRCTRAKRFLRPQEPSKTRTGRTPGKERRRVRYQCQ